MAYVVPHVSRGLVTRGQVQGPLQAAEGHVVLLGVEATETQVSEQLGIVDTHLEQSPEAERERGRGDEVEEERGREGGGEGNKGGRETERERGGIMFCSADVGVFKSVHIPTVQMWDVKGVHI